MTDFAKTSAALEAFDTAIEDLTAQIVAAAPAETDAILEKMTAEADKVSQAFYEDTKEQNALEMCMALRPGLKEPPPGQQPSFIRQCVANWKKSAEVLQ